MEKYDKLKIEENIKFFIIIFIIGILVFGGIYAFLQISEEFKPANISIKTAECIGNKSVLFISPYCPHCIKQKKMFKEKIKYINIVDCTNNSAYCIEMTVRGVPTWIINNTKYEGVMELWKLKELTKC